MLRHVFVDTEYNSNPFRRACATIVDPANNQVISGWADEGPLQFSLADDVVVHAFYGTGDIHYLELETGRRPKYYIDEHIEYALATNSGYGPGQKRGLSLLSALSHFNIPHISSAEKEADRQLFQRDSKTLSVEDRGRGLSYNTKDAWSDYELWRRLSVEPNFSLPHALNRGRLMMAVSQAERVGIPVDRPSIEGVRANRLAIINSIIELFDPTHHIFDPEGHYSLRAIEKFLDERRYLDIWPRTATGQISLEEDDFEVQVALHSKDTTLCRLFDALRIQKQLPNREPEKDFEIWDDGRAHFLFSPFRAKTSRFLPRTGKFPLGRPVFERRLYIAPPPGVVVGYYDYRGQELAILASLSGDPLLIEACRSGDPHLHFAKLADLVPASATKSTHPYEREIAKKVNFGVIYGQRSFGLSITLGCNTGYARRLLDLHRNIYRVAHRWLDDMAIRGLFEGGLTSLYGWQIATTQDTSANTLRNWQVQTTGAEMLRIALYLAVERGAKIAATLHDALLLVCNEDEKDHQEAITIGAMLEAGRIVLDGFEVGIDTPKLTHYPYHYYDERDDELTRMVARQIGLDFRVCEAPPHS